jgi:hypothetical protein
MALLLMEKHFQIQYFEWNQRSTLVKSKGLLSMSTYTFTMKGCVKL